MFLRCVLSALPQNNSLTHTFHCDDMAGRFVEVHFPNVLTSSTFTITLCEVEVYASAGKLCVHSHVISLACMPGGVV